MVASPTASGSVGPEDAEPSCPQAPIPRAVAPDVDARHRLVQTWLARLPAGDADAVLLDPRALPGLNARFSEVAGAFRDPLSPAWHDPKRVAEELVERAAWMHTQLEQGRYVEAQPGALATARALMARARVVDELHWVVAEAPLWCMPLDSGLYREPVDPAFDRNRCASLHPGEWVRVLRRADAGGVASPWLYVDAGHTTGWLHGPTLTPALAVEHVAPIWRGPRLVPLRDTVQTESGYRVRLGTELPMRGQDAQGYDVLVPTARGPIPDRVAKTSEVTVGPGALTRRALWTMALAELDKPYGWGGTGGARDCSRFLRDLMVTFGVQLARHSGVQAKLGTARVDVRGMSDAAKRQALAAAARRGVVLLYMPGHIMLYLGRDLGRDYAVSALSEWLEPCAPGQDTVFRLDRVAVSTLELGRGTERTAYIERITTLVVFGPDAEALPPLPTPGR